MCNVRKRWGGEPTPRTHAISDPRGDDTEKMDVTSWLLFIAVLTNQAGRVLVPAIKTSVIADPTLGPSFKEVVGAQLATVSLVCLAGKLIGAAVTDKLGGWLVLISVFVFWIAATFGTIMSNSVDVFGYAWFLNSFAYTITWGAVIQVIGSVYEKPEDKASQLAFASSASRFGATIGNVVFGQLLTFGLSWRQVCMPMIPVQALLLALCLYKWASTKPAAAPKKKDEKAADPPPSALSAFLSLDFWLMLIPKSLTFTYTQFFMNYIPQLLNVSYGFDHGTAATLGGVAQGGSIIGLLVVGNMFYKTLPAASKPTVIFVLLLVSTLASYALSLGPAVLPTAAVVPLTVVWGLAYVLPFYLPPGEYAMAVGGKSGTALFTNIFDASGFTVSAMWNPWASAIAKTGDFQQVLLSQAAFGAIAMVTMPLCMYRLNQKAEAAKKKK